MFTKTFMIERHIEELRAELRATNDAEEASGIQTELAAMTQLADDLDLDLDLDRESEETI